jgi:hypothetical protein
MFAVSRRKIQALHMKNRSRERTQGNIELIRGRYRMGAEKKN